MEDNLTPDEREQWNGFADHLNTVQGQPNAAYLTGYNKDNPKSTLTPEHIPVALNEINQLKSGSPVGKITPEQSKYIQDNMSLAFRKNTGSMYYPLSPEHGTNLEAHVAGVAAPPAGTIPAPNYNDPESRLKYAQAFTQKYGALMQGRGDTPLRINEIPDSGSAPARQLAINAASKLGVDPKLLYTSAMEEGMSGLYGDKKGQVDYSGDPKHPISGYVSFGLDTFADQYPDLVKKGLLPADFQSKFSPSKETNEKGQSVNSANFADTDSALQAKAAMMKSSQNDLEDFAKKKGITLSPKAKQFFSLIHYNAGAGNAQKMLQEYAEAGALKNDDFINKRPTSGGKLKDKSWEQPWTNVSRRLQMASALEKEHLW